MGPVESMSYDVYRGLLKKHLDTKAMKDLGLSPGDYSTHSFRKGGLSMLAEGDMHPVYIQKSARHKRIESSVPYIESSLYKALKANDLLSGTEPAEGWSSRYSGNKKSLSRFLPKKFIKDLPSVARGARGSLIREYFPNFRTELRYHGDGFGRSRGNT